MSSVARDIAQMLEDNGVGVFGTDLFVGREPASPPNAITVYDTGGGDPFPGVSSDNPSVQVRVRNASYLDGWDKAITVKDALFGIGHVTVNGRLFQSVWMTGDINPIGRDDNDRIRFTLNFSMFAQL